MRAINDYVILEPIEEDEMKSGIFIPEAHRGVTHKGIVVDSARSELKKGDKVMFKKYSDDRVDIDGKEYYFVQFKSCLIRYD